MIEVDVFWSFAIGAFIAAYERGSVSATASAAAIRRVLTLEVPTFVPGRAPRPCFRYAGNLLLREPSYSSNDYFIYNVLFLSLLFVPSGMYLLWQFPGTVHLAPDSRTSP